MTVTSAARRAFYLASAATSLALAITPAHAQRSDLSINNVRDSASSASALSIGDVRDSAQTGAALSIADARDMPLAPPISIMNVTENPNVTINNNFTPNDIRDPVNVTGIGQIVTDAGGGFVGLCTGSLINPRTVIFAAHCVNQRAATAYGANSGGVGVGVGFETNTRANAPGQPDELVNWLTGGSTGPGRFQSNRAQQFYNGNQVLYNPASLAPASCTVPTSCFLEADIAMLSLDTPTRGVPQWVLLFSPLTSPAAINPANGTGYHVGIAGYGNTGNGTTGSAASGGFRRRVAENMLGALTSINRRNLFLFGSTGTTSRPQLLYWTDFDDPARGTATADPEDFNGYRDNALTREGLTGPGDSGGPLIIDQAFSRPVVIGVLSGGSTFFGGQPGGSYGAQSFYQPLFLYWEWIVANNPYRYVTANAGNRNWEDAATWVTTLDPAYQILTGGQLVNGIPTELGGALVAQTPQFGEVCFQTPLNTPAPPAFNECENLATGAARNNVPNTPTGTGDASAPLTVQIVEGAQPADAEVEQAAASSSGTTTLSAGGRLSLADASDVAISGAASGLIDGAIESPEAAPGYRDGALPAPSIANGLPGATNFVPNNVDPVRTTGALGRYYDVTLRNAGTITLSSAVTIDRFAIAAATAGLTINNGASLTSLIDITQTAGTMNVNGTLASGGDYALIGGLLSGSGTVRTPFLTSVLGTIAPGTVGTIGTLTVSGNVILSSGTQTAIDLGANGVSDLLRTTANGTSTGSIDLGGALVLNPVARATFGSTYTIVNAAGGRTNTFASANALSAILRPTVTYTANTVLVQITAVPYLSVVNPNSPVQVAYARLLDGNRANYTLLADLFGELDVLSQAQIQTVLETAAPRTEATQGSLARMSTDTMGRFYRDRISFLASGESGGTLTMIGNPIQLASNAINNMGDNAGGMQTMNDAGSSNLVQAHGVLPDHVSAFLAGGFLDGRADALPSLIAGRDELNGYYIAGGLELDLNEDTRIGVAIHYVDTEGLSPGNQSTDGSLVEGNFYSMSNLGGGLIGTTQLSVGEFSVESRRPVVVGGTTFDLRGRNDGLAASGEIGLGYQMPVGSLTLTPNVAGRYTLVDFGDNRETGGGLALVIDSQRYESLQGRIGVDLGGTIEGSVSISPRLTANWIHEFMDQPTLVRAGFAATGFGAAAQNFILPNADRNWGEIGGGLRLNTGRVSIDLSADTTIARGDLNYRTYRAGVTLRF
ncbi:autotransporter domain-containing protein [Sphingosinicella sp.]|uniref:autotransporter domain-containing protein n=1 Tax=Sphingosinicella sp. TaxID=1917971 RepID=UPI0040383BA9